MVKITQFKIDHDFVLMVAYLLDLFTTSQLIIAANGGWED